MTVSSNTKFIHTWYKKLLVRNTDKERSTMRNNIDDCEFCVIMIANIELISQYVEKLSYEK